MEREKSGVKIWLLIEHREQETSHSMYLIEPPMEEEEEIDSDGLALNSISPMETIQGDPSIFSQCGMFRLGSRFYFLGGQGIYHWYKGSREPPFTYDDLKLSVQFFDIDNPELGFRRVGSLNAPKETPCVFSVRGHIYALGSKVKDCNLGDGGPSGVFERYNPDKDCWKVLPDPPKPFGEMADITWCDSATVVRDRYIYVGNTVNQLYFVFDLEKEHWASLPKSASHFPYGSLYVDDSLYYLTGIGSWKPGTQFDTATVDYDADDNEVRLVKRGPLPRVDDPVEFLNTISGHEQVMSTYTQLEGGNTWLTELDFVQWRDIFHLGGHFFCYVVTTQLMHHDNWRLSQPYCRGVWIKVFEEVFPDCNSTTKQPHFRTLASFSYRIRTPFLNNGRLIRCSAFGSVPDSWVKSPLKKKKVVTKERKALKAEPCQVVTIEKADSSLGVKAPLQKKQVAAKETEALKAEQSQHEHGGGSEGQRDGSLEKLLAAREEENSRLKAELAKKDKLLKDYESFLAKSKGKLVLIDQ